MLDIKCYDKGIFNENTYLIRDNDTMQAIIIDPGYYDREIEKLLSYCNVRYIIATHTHMDHVAELDKYRSACPDALFAYCENEKQLYDVPADLYLHDGDTLEFASDIIEIIATPGHTAGGICIRIGDIMFTGDTLFFMSVGRTDFETGSWEALCDSIRNKLYTLPEDITIYPGHGRKSSIANEKKANPYV